MAPNHSKLPVAKSTSWKMFDEISPRYDFLNHLLSFGLDIQWRRRLAQFLPKKEELKVLDLATGTADVLLSFFQNNPNIESGHGIDLAEKMLKIGRRKISQKGLNAQITLKHGDATKIPFENHEFDAVSMAFGIRNVENPLQVLHEMYRTVNQEGRALILEFSLPGNVIFRHLHLFYLRFIVPLIGGIVSGHFRAYKYLNQTIETFPYGDDFCEMMTIVGFKKVKAKPLLWGVATIYQGDKE